MKEQPLQRMLSADMELTDEVRDIGKKHYVRPIYYWDETEAGHIGAGWLIEYIVLGVGIGAGVATASFLKSYFTEAGKAAWQATVKLFRHVAEKLQRKKMFFFARTQSKSSEVVVWLDDSLLKRQDVLDQAYDMMAKLLFLIETDDVFITQHCRGTLVIKYDDRCNDLMIYMWGSHLNLPEAVPMMPYSWLFHDGSYAKEEFTELHFLFLARAIFHRSLHEMKQAEEYFRNAISAKPEFPTAYFQMGNMFFLDEQYRKAINAWDKMISMEGDRGAYVDQAYFNIACAYSKMGDFDAAAENLKKAVAAGVDPYLVQRDPDLQEFRQDKRFQEIEQTL